MVAALKKRGEAGRARREEGNLKALPATGAYLLARLKVWPPVRAWNLYTLRHGALMAAGCAYNMFFAVAAMLVAGFSIFGLVASGNRELQLTVVEVVTRSTPGLIDTDDGDGLFTPEELFAQGGAFGFALIISTTAMVLISLRWISGLRQGTRGIFGLPRVQANPVLVKLRDALALLILAVAVAVTSAAAFVANAALDLLIDWFQFSGDASVPLTRISSILVMLLLDTAVAVILFRFASRIRMPRAVMFQSALLAGIGSTFLRYFSSSLLGNVGNTNPLLAPFAVILGLFVWFYLLSQVYLLAAAWGAVGKADVLARDHSATRDRRSLSQRARELRRRDAGLERKSSGRPTGGLIESCRSTAVVLIP